MLLLLFLLLLLLLLVVVVVSFRASFALGLLQSSCRVSTRNLRQLEVIFFVAYIDNGFLIMCAVLGNTTFCISARFCLPGIFSRCFAVPFFTNLNAPTAIRLINDVINCHTLSTSMWRSLYFDRFLNPLAEIFTSIGTVKSSSLHVFSSRSFIVMYGLFTFIVLSVWIGKSHKTVALFLCNL